VAEVVSMNGKKHGGGCKTPPELAAQMRKDLETLLEQGILAGLVSGELPDGQVLYIAAPSLTGFIDGHLTQLRAEFDSSGED